jgi:hypothetical protein
MPALIIFFSSLPPFALAAQHPNPFLSLKENQTLNLSYNIYSSGFKIATQNMTFVNINNKLFFSSLTSTTGIGNVVSNSLYTSEVIADIKPLSLNLLSYRIVSEQGTIFPKKDGGYIHYAQDGSNSYKYIPINNVSDDQYPPSFDKKHTQNSIPWNALISSIMMLPNSLIKSCQIAWNIFDIGTSGRLSLSSPKSTQISPGAYTKYRGKAQSCSVSYTPSPSKDNDNDRNTETVKGEIVIASIFKVFPVPIKFFLPQNELNIIMHLTDYSIKDNPDHKPFNLLPDIPLPS